MPVGAESGGAGAELRAQAVEPVAVPGPPLFSPREEPEPWCKPRTLQGASTSFEYNGRLQYWTVPETGVYRITARGAKAADGHHRCAA